VAGDLRGAIRRLVVVGGSVAAARAVEEARRVGFDGEVTIVSKELHPPYDRPPLSKQFLVSEHDPERDTLIDVDSLGVRLMADTAATGLSVRNHVVLTSGGDVPYDAVILATGAEPRSLDLGAGIGGVCVLRTADDAMAIRDRLHPGARVVVVGAGFIGGEVASSCRARGADVTLVEELSLPLEKAVGSLIAERLALLHRQNGVDLRTRVTVKGVEGGAEVEKVVLSDGSRIDADLVVVGIGVVPSTGWLRGTGVTVNDGVACTPYLESTVPDVYAAGDIARWVNPWSGRSTRLEHWTAAGEQAEIAVRNALTEEREVCSIVPYFWSEWYGHKLQMLGEPATEVELTGEGGAVDPFLAVFRYDGRQVGAFALDRTGPLMRRRRAITARAPWGDLLHDGSVSA